MFLCLSGTLAELAHFPSLVGALVKYLVFGLDWLAHLGSVADPHVRQRKLVNVDPGHVVMRQYFLVGFPRYVPYVSVLIAFA